MITQDQIRDLGSRYNIDKYTILREYLQLVFLSDLYNEKDSDKIFFKGGTALRLLYNSFRFSEDLDFTSILSGKKLLSIIDRVLIKSRLIVPDLQIKSVRLSEISLTGFLSLKTIELKYPLNVHLDFSLREQPFTSKDSVLETLFPIGAYPIIRHLELKEILAEKVRALMARAKGRDYFDLWFLLSKQIPLDWEMINKKMAYYKEETCKDDLINKIRQIDTKKMELDLGKFLPVQQRKIVSTLKSSLLEKL